LRCLFKEQNDDVSNRTFLGMCAGPVPRDGMW
jgi:hypothetical protein